MIQSHLVLLSGWGINSPSVPLCHTSRWGPLGLFLLFCGLSVLCQPRQEVVFHQLSSLCTALRPSLGRAVSSWSFTIRSFMSSIELQSFVQRDTRSESLVTNSRGLELLASEPLSVCPLIIEYGSTLYIGIHKVFQLLTYNSKMRRTMKLKST